MSICTLTFSPCIDKSSSVAALIPEQKLKCRMPELDPGGGGINVARAIKKLGTDATAIFPSGGYTGKLFNHLLEKENIPVIIIPCQQETRENFIIREESTNNQFRFGMPGTPLSESEWKACLEAIEKMQDLDFIVASGSLPPGVPLDIYAMLARIARTKKARLVVDTSGEALQHAAEEGVYLLKPNLGELASLAGTNKIEPGKVEEFAKKIINENKCEVLVVSMGKSGAMLVTKDESHTIKAPEVERKSTVGAGDSMVAGIVYSLYHKKSLKETIQFGVACGSAATMNEGTELFRKEDVGRLLVQIQSS